MPMSYIMLSISTNVAYILMFAEQVSTGATWFFVWGRFGILGESYANAS